jgi:AraC-like DNA-binding protein
MGDYGELEYAAASCASVREAIDFFCRHYSLLDESSTIDPARAGERVRISLRKPAELTTRACVDFVLSMFYLGHGRWRGEPPREYEVEFPYAQPSDLGPYRAVFGTETRLRFDTDAGAVLFLAADLDLPLRYSDPKLHALLASHLRERTPASFQPSFIGRVRAKIRDELRSGSASIDGVARRLAMSRRSLARKLEEEGTSFKQLLCDVRRACAVRYLLLEGYTMQQISRQLGYGDTGAFHRAFRSWFGQTPSSYRDQQRRSA